MKRTVFAVFAVFVAWTGLDFVVHGVILAPAYSATPQLWRPMAEMKVGLMNLVVFTTAAMFVLIYAWLIAEKSVKAAVKYGILFGIGSGISMGYGSFSAMPLPHTIAFWWFFGKLIEAVAAGWLTGLIVKQQRKNNWVPFGMRERGDYIKY